MNFTYVTAYDIIAKMAGAERPGEWIVRGNHHDGWVNGAADPLSGAVTVMEEAKAIAALAKTGWKPKRTLVYCLWDGEEPGLLGSSSWAEAHESELREHAAIYVNSDGNSRGFLFAQGSHSLERMMGDIASEVVDPERGVDIARRQLAAQKLRLDGYADAQSGDEGGADVAAPEEPGTAFHIDALGSGSDYTPFVQHVGVASMNLGFGGESGNGSYHSIFDSFDEFTRFKDPTFAYGVTLAKTAGRIVLRFADADVLPYAFGPSAETIAKYAHEVGKLADDERKATIKRNDLIDSGAFTDAADPTQKFVPPTKRDTVPTIDFSALNEAVAALQSSAKAYDDALNLALAGTTVPDSAAKTDLVLLAAEHALTTPTGLPRRPWYRHQLYAPGFYTGYGVKTMPYIREAIEQRNWEEARTGIATVAQSLLAYRTQIDAARTALGGK
jgi:N-acetylated-alpha-linked acidic dipeptidase